MEEEIWKDWLLKLLSKILEKQSKLITLIMTNQIIVLVIYNGYNKKTSGVSQSCKNPNRTFMGYHWEYMAE